MSKLQLGPIEDDTPAKLLLELPAAVQCDLIDYAKALAAESGDKAVDRRARQADRADAEPVHGQ